MQVFCIFINPKYLKPISKGFKIVIHENNFVISCLWLKQFLKAQAKMNEAKEQ
jgi:hypothetical protein